MYGRIKQNLAHRIDGLWGRKKERFFSGVYYVHIGRKLSTLGRILGSSDFFL